MGIDRTDDTENVENPPAADGRPPPPPDRPGTDDYPSRADSREGATAANDTTAPTGDGLTDDRGIGEDGTDSRREEISAEIENNDESVAENDSGAEEVEGPSSLGERMRVDDKPLREYLDPVGAAAWSNEIGDQPGDPSDRKGDRIADTGGGEKTRAERLRGKFHREGTDAMETVSKASGHVKGILSHPPAGYAAEGPGPAATTASHDGFAVSDTLTALMATGVVLGETARFVHKRFAREKGHEDGDHR